jgi:hypothetical protein
LPVAVERDRPDDDRHAGQLAGLGQLGA